MTIQKLSSSTTEYCFDKTFWEGWRNISGCILQSQLSVFTVFRIKSDLL